MSKSLLVILLLIVSSLELDENSKVNLAEEGRTNEYFDWKNFVWEKIDRMKEKVGPGPNYFTKENIIAPPRPDDPLTLKITRDKHNGYCSTFWMPQALGYGTYQIDLNQKVEDIADKDPNVVFGFFLYKNDTYEIDIEIAKWGNEEPDSVNMDYVSQPHIEGVTGLTFMLPHGHQRTRHSFTWAPDKISWQALDIDTGEVFYEWFTTENLREPDDQFNLYFNFWMMSGLYPRVDEQYITLTDFKYTKYEKP